MFGGRRRNACANTVPQKRKTEMKTLAVIGCGGIANNAHFPALTEIKDVRIKYACDIIPEKAQKILEKYLFVGYFHNGHIAFDRLRRRSKGKDAEL